ncbi:MAG: 16S rRNA (cytosine(967)-C(5))-methyltransferase RsmB [Alphaproteobacteria bacterium]
MTVLVDERKKTVRALAGQILRQVEAQKAYADRLLDQALGARSLSDRDRALLTELVYGTLRWRGKIDAQLVPYLHRPLADIDPLIRNLLRLAVYQLLFLDKIPDHAAVNEAVELAKSRGGAKAAGFTNAVLRNFIRREKPAKLLSDEDNSVAALAVVYSHPEWLVERWLREFGLEATRSLMQANNEKAPLVLRVNSHKTSRAELLQRLLHAGIDARATERSPQGIRLESSGAVEKLPGFAEGLFQVQSEASQLVGNLLSPLSGERILDACAAPGGKSTHIAELMKDQGELIAIDSSARGVEKIIENAGRLGFKSVQVMRADASDKIGGLKLASFDRILADAPCSGFGTLRGHPEIKWHRNHSDIQRLSRLQAKILRRVATYLKPGGVLVYATCTLAREENDQVVDAFLAEHKSFELEHASRYLPIAAEAMVRGAFFFALPQRDDTDGFFAARMRKVS